MSKLFTVLPALLILAGAPAQAQTGEQTPSPVADLATVTPTDRVLGDREAPVTLVIYSSFLCAACASWHAQVLPDLKAAYLDTGKAALVFRDFPVAPAELSGPAAAIGRCALPERFPEVAESLMAGQAALREGGSALTWYQGAIAVSGRTHEEIEACVSDPGTSAAITAEATAGESAGFTRLPGVLVNGRPVEDISILGLSAAIEGREVAAPDMHVIPIEVE